MRMRPSGASRTILLSILSALQTFLPLSTATTRTAPLPLPSRCPLRPLLAPYTHLRRFPLPLLPRQLLQVVSKGSDWVRGHRLLLSPVG